MRRLALVFSLVLALSFLVTLMVTLPMAAAEPKMGGRLVVANALTLPHLDVDKSTDSSIGQIMYHVYEGLFEVDESFRPVPHLASDYQVNSSGTEYVINLREGVLFHNGKEMTAEDVAASFHRYLANNGGGRNIAPYIEQVAVTGPYQLKVLFNQPYAPFLYFLSSVVANQKFVVRPKELIEKFDDQVMTEHIGTGPFQFDGWVPDQYVRLSRFADYVPHLGPYYGYSGEKHAYVDELEFRIIREQSVRTAGVRTGEFHFADAAPRDQLGLFEANDKVQTYVVSPFRQAFLILNKGNPPLDNLKVRQALLRAIDVEEMGYAVVGDPNFWFLNPSLFPPGHLWHVPEAGKGIYGQPDRAAATKLLKEAGYQGETIVILNSREDEIESRSALALQAQLQEIGINVEVRLLDRATVVDKRAQKDGYHLHFSQFISPDPDPQVYQAWMGTNKWIGNWDDQDSRVMDAIFEEMLVETDPERRYEIVARWQEAFYKYVPYIKLYDFKQLRLAHSSLQGYSNYVHPTFFNVWLEE